MLITYGLQKEHHILQEIKNTLKDPTKETRQHHSGNLPTKVPQKHCLVHHPYQYRHQSPSYI